jgi:thymidylate kinase
MKKRMVCLVGLDGSGKTAHSIALIDHLRKARIKCRCIWFGNAYFLSFPFMIVCRMLGLTTIYRIENRVTVSEHKYYKNKAISKIWPYVQFVDVMIFVNFRVKMLLWRGFTIVCDRFVPDIIVELMTDVNDTGLYKKRIGRLMFRLMPHGSLLVTLDVNEETARRRKSDIPRLGYLSQRRNNYRLISSYLEIPLVNAEERFEFVQQNLVDLVDGSNQQDSNCRK